MKLETALRWSWMNILNRKRYEALIAEHGDMDSAFQNLSVGMLGQFGIKEESAMKAIVRVEEFPVDQYKAQMQKRDLRIITIEDDDYPARLREIADYPLFLYVRGDIEILSQPCISIVGSREMSDYGRRVVGHIVPPIVDAGCITVSGLAFGIDAEVAKETIRAGGKTVAVLGHGLGMIYPKANERLAGEIVKGGGLLMSEFPLDVQPDKYTFPSRNRIIAGLGLATVVAEAAEDSGSLITAELALEYGRDVCAVPGDLFNPMYAGCHGLIARGNAKLVTSAGDILTEVGIVAGTTSAKNSYEPQSPEETSIYGALTTLPAPLDELTVKTKLDAATINSVLTILEIQGAVKNVGSGKWVKT